MASCLILCGVILTGDTEFTQLYMDIFRQQGMDLENIAGGVQLAANVLYINAGGCLLMVLLNLVLFFTRSRRAALVNLIPGQIQPPRNAPFLSSAPRVLAVPKSMNTQGPP